MEKQDVLGKLEQHFDVVLSPETSTKDVEYNSIYLERFLADKKTLLARVTESPDVSIGLEKMLMEAMNSRKKLMDKRETVLDSELAEFNAQLDFNQSFISFMEEIKRV